jgi:hypothetical protein
MVSDGGNSLTIFNSTAHRSRKRGAEAADLTEPSDKKRVALGPLNTSSSLSSLGDYSTSLTSDDLSPSEKNESSAGQRTNSTSLAQSGDAVKKENSNDLIEASRRTVLDQIRDTVEHDVSRHHTLPDSSRRDMVRNHMGQSDALLAKQHPEMKGHINLVNSIEKAHASFADLVYYHDELLKYVNAEEERTNPIKRDLGAKYSEGSLSRVDVKYGLDTRSDLDLTEIDNALKIYKKTDDYRQRGIQEKNSRNRNRSQRTR